MSLSFGVLQPYFSLETDQCAAFYVHNETEDAIAKIKLDQFGSEYKGFSLSIASVNSKYHTHEILCEHKIQEINCCTYHPFIIQVEGKSNQNIRVSVEEEVALNSKTVQHSQCCDGWTPVSFGHLITVNFSTGSTRKSKKELTQSFTLVLENPIGFSGWPKTWENHVKQNPLAQGLFYFDGGEFASGNSEPRSSPAISNKKLMFDAFVQETISRVLIVTPKKIALEYDDDEEDYQPTQSCGADDNDEVPSTPPPRLVRKAGTPSLKFVSKKLKL